MKSPFPGMDPYIEACGLWGDFHATLIAEIKQALARELSDRYVVRTGERSYLVLVGAEGKRDHPFLPDVSVAAPSEAKKSSRKSAAAVAEPAGEVEPLTLRPFVEEEHRESFIEIYETDPTQRLVTSIEMLSPSNKRPGTPGYELYLRKRQSLLLSPTSLVEIDLLRGGERMPMLDPWPDSPYTFLVSRAAYVRLCKVWPVHLQRPLPPLLVPLAKPDPDIPLNLQPMIESIYRLSRYDRSIDYRKPLAPPLTHAESAWLKRQMKGRT